MGIKCKKKLYHTQNKYECCEGLTEYKGQCVDKCDLKFKLNKEKCCGDLIKNSGGYCDTRKCISDGKKKLDINAQNCCDGLIYDFNSNKCKSLSIYTSLS